MIGVKSQNVALFILGSSERFPVSRSESNTVHADSTICREVCLGRGGTKHASPNDEFHLECFCALFPFIIH